MANVDVVYFGRTTAATWRVAWHPTNPLLFVVQRWQRQRDHAAYVDGGWVDWSVQHLAEMTEDRYLGEAFDFADSLLAWFCFCEVEHEGTSPDLWCEPCQRRHEAQQRAKATGVDKGDVIP